MQPRCFGRSTPALKRCSQRAGKFLRRRTHHLWPHVALSRSGGSLRAQITKDNEAHPCAPKESCPFDKDRIQSCSAQFRSSCTCHPRPQKKLKSNASCSRPGRWVGPGKNPKSPRRWEDPDKWPPTKSWTPTWTVKRVPARGRIACSETSLPPSDLVLPRAAQNWTPKRRCIFGEQNVLFLRSIPPVTF